MNHLRRSSACPICRKEVAERYRPFCSKRCADIDLNRWMTESYRIPAEEAEAPGDEATHGAPAHREETKTEDGG